MCRRHATAATRGNESTTGGIGVGAKLGSGGVFKPARGTRLFLSDARRNDHFAGPSPSALQLAAGRIVVETKLGALGVAVAAGVAIHGEAKSETERRKTRQRTEKSARVHAAEATKRRQKRRPLPREKITGKSSDRLGGSRKTRGKLKMLGEGLETPSSSGHLDGKSCC